MNKKDMFIKEKLQKDKEISDRANKIFDNIKEEFKVENNEKKVIKISFNTFLAITACLIIVGFVGINIYANSLGKPNIISGIQALVKNEPEVNVDEIAKELFEKGSYEIRKLEYSSLVNEEYEVADEFIEKEINGRLYVKTNEKYETVKQKYGEIFTGEALENVLSRRFDNVNGILYICHGGATGWDITNIEIEKINEENGELTYRASYNNVNVDESISEEKFTCEFKIKEVNGEYKISATNYCNLGEKQEAIEDNTTNNNLDDETAKSIIQSYLNIIGVGSPTAALTIQEIGLIDENSEIPGGDYIDDEGYRSSNIKYEDFKSKMLQYMTEELFNRMINDTQAWYKNINGKLYIYQSAWTGTEHIIQEIELISSNKNNYIYKINGSEGVDAVENGARFTAEVELQKTGNNNKYIVSKLNWEEEQKVNDIINNEKVGTVSAVNAMLEMLKYRNEEYRANYYYRLAALRDNNDGTYTATVDFYSPIYITQEKYNDMVNNKKVDINGIAYTFSNENSEFNIGYGYITASDGQQYRVEKQERGYAFYHEIGGVLKIIDTIGSSFEMTLNEDTIVNVIFKGEDTLKNCFNLLTDSVISNNMITFEYSQENGYIFLLRDVR